MQVITRDPVAMGTEAGFSEGGMARSIGLRLGVTDPQIRLLTCQRGRDERRTR
jgi:hypothetical protein